MICSYVVEVSKIPADNLALLGSCDLNVNNIKHISGGDGVVKCELS